MVSIATLWAKRFREINILVVPFCFDRFSGIFTFYNKKKCHFRIFLNRFDNPLIYELFYEIRLNCCWYILNMIGSVNLIKGCFKKRGFSGCGVLDVYPSWDHTWIPDVVLFRSLIFCWNNDFIDSNIIGIATQSEGVGVVHPFWIDFFFIIPFLINKDDTAIILFVHWGLGLLYFFNHFYYTFFNGFH